tara:strand:- start:142 stop:483 length:342 start_codon:yes stop_codon:yes gene_type:complete
MFKFLIVALGLTAAAAYFTKPTAAEVDTQFNVLLQQAIAAGKLSDIADPAAVLMLAACKANAATCADLARAAMTVEYTDAKLLARVRVEGFGKTTTCYGAFTKLFCPGGLTGS